MNFIAVLYHGAVAVKFLSNGNILHFRVTHTDTHRASKNTITPPNGANPAMRQDGLWKRKKNEKYFWKRAHDSFRRKSKHDQTMSLE